MKNGKMKDLPRSSKGIKILLLLKFFTSLLLPRLSEGMHDQNTKVSIKHLNFIVESFLLDLAPLGVLVLPNLGSTFCNNF